MGGAKRIFFVLCKRYNVKRELWKSMLFQSIFLNVFSHAHAFSRKLWTDDLFFSLPIL